jgi:hypothetical protein
VRFLTDILRYPQNHRPRNLFCRPPRKNTRTQTGTKMKKFLKELPGRPYSARGDGSHRVLLPFLTRISSSLYHRRRVSGNPTRPLAACEILIFGGLISIPEHPHPRNPSLQEISAGAGHNGKTHANPLFTGRRLRPGFARSGFFSRAHQGSRSPGSRAT